MPLGKIKLSASEDIQHPIPVQTTSVGVVCGVSPCRSPSEDTSSASTHAVLPVPPLLEDPLDGNGARCCAVPVMRRFPGSHGCSRQSYHPQNATSDLFIHLLHLPPASALPHPAAKQGRWEKEGIPSSLPASPSHKGSALEWKLWSARCHSLLLRARLGTIGPSVAVLQELL